MLLSLGKGKELKVGRERAVRKGEMHFEHTSKCFLIDYLLNISVSLLFTSLINSMVKEAKT